MNETIKKLLPDVSYASTSSVCYDEAADMVKVRFFDQRRFENVDTFCSTFDHKYSENEISKLLDQVLDVLRPKYELNYTMYSEKNIIIVSTDGVLLIEISRNTVHVYGDRQITEYLTEILSEQNERCNVYWYYINRGSYDYQKFRMSYDLKAYDEHYPFLPGCNLKKYMQDYYDSKASILVLMGEPGTGKTSWIKQFIKTYNMNAMVSYDEKIIEQDEFYVEFMKEDERDIMIIEDADLLLTSRESDANKAMSRLLNLSDGLVNVLSKKIIFTTNLADISKIDNALIRPGRCFDVVDFRKLYRGEHQIVSDIHGLPYLDKEEATLSEVFNQEDMTFKRGKFGIA